MIGRIKKSPVLVTSGRSRSAFVESASASSNGVIVFRRSVVVQIAFARNSRSRVIGNESHRNESQKRGAYC